MSAPAAWMQQPALAWWRDEATLHRFVCDLIAPEVAHARPTSPALTPARLHGALHLQRDIGLDSIELVPVALALTESLHLHESGIEDRLLVDATIDGWVATARDGLECFSRSMTFRTSGSQGAPKRCTHEMSTLRQEIDAHAPLFAGRRRVLSAVRGHHIYGFLFTVLLPRALGLQSECVVDVRGRIPTSLRRELRDGDLVIGHPDFWRSIATLGEMPPGVAGVTSTSHCPPDVARQLSSAGLESFVEIYGSSETGGVGVRTGADDPYALLPYWERASEDDAILHRRMPDGQVMPYPLQDTLEWAGERRFRPIGRLDGAIQVAGVNVFADRVRSVLLQHPSVLDAAVRRMRRDEASRLEAFVALHPGISGDAALHAELESWVASRLTAPERPRAFTFDATLLPSA